MSAYVVEDDVIQAIVTWMGSTKQHNAANHIEMAGLTKATPTERCQALLDLNMKSVDGRYRTESQPGTIQFKTVLVPPIPLYKLLCGYLYNACEGDCDEQPLYKGLDAMKDELACNIVESTKEYKTANWV